MSAMATTDLPDYDLLGILGDRLPGSPLPHLHCGRNWPWRPQTSLIMTSLILLEVVSLSFRYQAWQSHNFLTIISLTLFEMLFHAPK